MVKKEMISLLYKAYQGTLTGEEERRLMAWVDEKPEHRAIYEKLTDPIYVDRQVQRYHRFTGKQLNSEAFLRKLKARIADEERKKERPELTKEWWDSLVPEKQEPFWGFGTTLVVFMIGLFICSLVVMYFQNRPEIHPIDAFRAKVFQLDTFPKELRYQVAIYGPDEETDLVQGSQNDFYRKYHGSEIKNTDSVLYITYSSSYFKNGELITGKHLVVSTPPGAHYKVMLPDSSLIHLNANTTIRINSPYENDRRVVYLKGEAFFDVKPRRSGDRKVPFVVRVMEDYQGTPKRVEVLGTRFNVEAYDHSAFKTSVETGLVRIGNGQSFVQLTDGQSTTARTNSIDTVRTNAGRSDFDWLDGAISFDQDEVESILRRVGNWYGIPVHYLGGLLKSSTHRYSGKLPPSSSASSLANTLQTFGITVTYDSAKNRLVVD